MKPKKNGLSWCPLVAINTPDDLTALIVEPTKQLLEGNAEPKNFDKRILRFEVHGDQVKVRTS